MAIRKIIEKWESWPKPICPSCENCTYWSVSDGCDAALFLETWEYPCNDD